MFKSPSNSANRVLTSLQNRAYASETEENFRWISSLLATRSKHVLSADDLVTDEEICRFVSDVGQYAELAHGSISPDFVFRNTLQLCQPGYPLEGYHALRQDEPQFVQSFRGNVADLQGYSAFRSRTRQLVIAFSGTSTPSQTYRDLQAWMTTYPRDPRRSSTHFGFWKLYQGVRQAAFDSILIGFERHGGEVQEIVLTGHSMGCAMAFFLALDLITGHREDSPIPNGIPISLVAFGSPRLANEGLVKYWRQSLNSYREKFGPTAFQEYSLKGYNDGVHTLPLYRFGFRHLSESPLYLYHGSLYRIPASENEHGSFTVIDLPETASDSESTMTDAVSKALTVVGTDHYHAVWPRGGHNYYFRDMEDLQRRMRWLELKMHGETGWKERYMLKLEAWEKKWGLK